MTTRRPLGCMLVMSLAIGTSACVNSGRAEVGSGPKEAHAPARALSVTPEKSEGPKVPSLIVNQFGTVSTAGYDGIARRSTADHPYGPMAGGASYPAIDRLTLVRRSGAAVGVEVLSISNPHFNTDDGGVRINPEGGVDGGPIQDVRVQILERWGDRLGLPEVFDLVVFGGQVEFVLTDEQARAARLPKGGRFVTGKEPSVELAVGERALLLVTRGRIGWVGGERQALRVMYGEEGKFTLTGDWVSDLRHEIQRELGADCPGGPAAGRCPT